MARTIIQRRAKREAGGVRRLLGVDRVARERHADLDCTNDTKAIDSDVDVYPPVFLGPFRFRRGKSMDIARLSVTSLAVAALVIGVTAAGCSKKEETSPSRRRRPHHRAHPPRPPPRRRAPRRRPAHPRSRPTTARFCIPPADMGADTQTPGGVQLNPGRQSGCGPGLCKSGRQAADHRHHSGLPRRRSRRLEFPEQLGHAQHRGHRCT